MIDMTEVEDDSDSVEEGEVWEEEGGYLVISTDKVDSLFVCLLLLLLLLFVSLLFVCLDGEVWDEEATYLVISTDRVDVL